MKPLRMFTDIPEDTCISCKKKLYDHYIDDTTEKKFKLLVCPDGLTDLHILQIISEHLDGCCYHCSDHPIIDNEILLHRLEHIQIRYTQLLIKEVMGHIPPSVTRFGFETLKESSHVRFESPFPLGDPKPESERSEFIKQALNDQDNTDAEIELRVAERRVKRTPVSLEFERKHMNKPVSEDLDGGFTPENMPPVKLEQPEEPARVGVAVKHTITPISDDPEWTCKFCGQTWSKNIGLCNCKEGLKQPGRLHLEVEDDGEPYPCGCFLCTDDEEDEEE